MALPIKVMNAIKWYSKQHDLVPQLSAYPQLRFKDANGNDVMVEAFNLLTAYGARGKKK